MESQRHPNPLRDTRRPFDGSRPATNPPVFVWRALPDAGAWGLTVSKNPDLSVPVIHVRNLGCPYFLLDQALAPGQYHWQWRDDRGHCGQVFAFTIEAAAKVVEVPFVDDLLSRIPRSHPRIWVRSPDLAVFRDSRQGERAALWRQLSDAAEGILNQPHELAEPPYLPDYHTDHDGWFRGYNKAMVESRVFLGGAEVLALAFLASGEVKYARAACRRMVAVAGWAPDGATWIEHNDEPHMSVVNWGPYICDWGWDHFSDDEKDLIVGMFRRRGELAIRFMRSFGHYGSTHYGSHHGREIAFLGTMCLVFHDRIPEARVWLEWLRPVLCGIWPLWAGEDGGWAEGPHYSVAYVGVMARFAAALATATGIDLFQRPFWSGYLQWLKHCCPPDVEWIGFGDGAKHRGQADAFTADMVKLLAFLTNSAGLEAYVEKLHEPNASLFLERVDLSYASPMVYAFNPRLPTTVADREANDVLLRVFPGAGWAALHTHIGDPERDIVFTFRSSPYGSISHSHADHNDFALHVAGVSLLIPSGVYDGWATNHHTHWVWHTKSANCLTLSDGGQTMRSEDAVGAIEHPYEDERLAYWRGNADAAYLQAERCRRHVVFLKQACCFLLIDEFVAQAGVPVSLQWNVHAWSPPEIDERAGCFRVERDGSSVVGHMLWHAQGFFTLSDQACPPPMADGFETLPFPEYNLTYTPWGLVETGRNLGVLLCPAHGRLAPPEVRSERLGGDETARIGGTLVTVHPQTIQRDDGLETVATITTGSTVYLVGSGGLRHNQ